MHANQLDSKIYEYIKDLEEAHGKCLKGILKMDNAQELIRDIRESLSELLSNNSDAYDIYNRHQLENMLWWETTKGHGYVEKSNCSNIENEIIILKGILLEMTPGYMVQSVETKEVMHIHKGERSKALRFIHGIMKQANTSLFVIDSYLDDSIYDHITSLNSSITFQLLTTEEKLKPIFIKITEKLQKEDWNIILKSTTSFHDRYIIVDDNDIWSIGTSIKDAGNKEHTISKIKDIEEIIKIKERFDNEWEDSVTLCELEFNVIDYRVDLQFPVYIQNGDEEKAKSKAKKLGEDWINKVEKVIGEKLLVVRSETDCIDYLIKIFEPFSLTLSWSYRGYNGTTYFIASSIKIVTPDRSGLDKVIKAGNYPYWAIYYTLDSELDLEAIKDQIYKRTGQSVRVGGYSIDSEGNKSITSLEHKNELGLLFQLHRGGSGQGRITLNYTQGALDRGFKKAHEVFTPRKILSVFYGEFTSSDFKKLVEKAS